MTSPNLSAPVHLIPSQTSPAASPLPGCRTLADVLTLIDADRRLSDVRKREFGGAVRSVCAMLGCPPDAVTASLSDIERRLAQIPSALRKQSKKTVANTRSRLKAAFSHLAGAGSRPARGAPLAPTWQALYDRLPDRRMRLGLSRLIRYASHRGLDPTEVNDAFTQELMSSVRWNGGRRTTPVWRNTVAIWNQAVETVPGWPATRLTPPASHGRERHLALTEFPASFNHDLDAYLHWASGADRFADSAPKTPLKPGTIRLQRDNLRLAASALAKHFKDPQRVTGLAVLVEPANATAILLAFLERTAAGEPTAFIRGIATTLASVATYWVKVNEVDLNELKRLKSRLGTTPNGLTAKNLDMLRRFDDPALVRKLVLLPDVLAAQARTGRMTLQRRLQKMQIALAIQLLLAVPMRMQNLATLRLDRQVQWPSGRGGPVHIVLGDSETKNSLALDYQLGARTRDFLHDYLDQWRKYVTAPDSPWLFAHLNGDPVPVSALRDGIVKALRRELGIAMTPHQFRHLAAKLMLDANPGAIALVKDFLGHRNIKTTLAFYAGMRTREAALEYDRILERALEDFETTES